MTIDRRIEKLEAVNDPVKTPDIEITFVSCSQQVKNPELFRKVPNDITIAGKQTFRMEAIDPNFKCDLYCCEDKE